ncbi:MAG: hypothetical protein UIH18_09925 [Fibrobacteraceae bacterium]|nr:hypothetical protein [Fibrobacteraceae bacterium]
MKADCVHHATSVARGRLTFRLRGKIFTFHRNDKKLAASSGLSWRGVF